MPVRCPDKPKQSCSGGSCSSTALGAFPQVLIAEAAAVVAVVVAVVVAALATDAVAAVAVAEAAKAVAAAVVAKGAGPPRVDGIVEQTIVVVHVGAGHRTNLGSPSTARAGAGGRADADGTRASRSSRVRRLHRQRRTWESTAAPNPGHQEL